MKGYIRLYRELIDKPIWLTSTPEQRVIFITLLCMVNYRGARWVFDGEEYEVTEGQIITSLPEIVNKCKSKNITIQKVRTALDKFERLGFLTSKSTNKNRLITIVNWRLYQESGNKNSGENNRRITGSWQADNSQITGNQQADNSYQKRTKKIKNIKKIKNNNKEQQRGYEDEDTELSTGLSTKLSTELSTEPRDEAMIPSVIPNLQKDLYVNEIKIGIDYDYLCSVYGQKKADCITNLICDITDTDDDEVRIGGKIYPREYVEDLCKGLEYEHACRLIEKMGEISTNNSIRNPKRYMQGCILTMAEQKRAEI